MRKAMDDLFGPPQRFDPERVGRIYRASLAGECSNADRQELARRIGTVSGWPSDVLWTLQRSAGLAVAQPDPLPGLPPGDFAKTYLLRNGFFDHRVALVGTNPSRCHLVYDQWTGSLSGYRPTKVFLWDENSPPSATPEFTLQLGHGDNAFAIRGSVNREKGTFSISWITGPKTNSGNCNRDDGPQWYMFNPEGIDPPTGMTMPIASMQ
jgi:hypothetical protein